MSVNTEKAKLFGTATQQLRARQTELATAINGNKSILQAQKGVIDSLITDIDKYRSRNEALSKSINDVSTKLKDQLKATGDESKEVKDLQKELAKLQGEYNRNENAISKATNNMNNYKAKANETEKSIMQNQKALQDLNKEMAGAKWDSVSQKTGAVANKLSGASMAITGFGLAAAKMSMDFDESMAKVSTIADTSVPIDKLKASITDLSNQTGVDAKTIANNVYDAISAGQKTGDAVNFVSNSIKLSKAGFADAGQSLDVLTTIMNSYKLKAEDVTKVSDVLIKTQNLGKVTVGELSADMGKVIPTAANLGVSVEQLGAGYAIMTSNGIKSAETTTYMNSMFNELGKSGTQVDKILRQQTGQSFQQLSQHGKTTGDVLNILNEYAKKSGGSLTDLFGSAEAGKAALLLSSNAGKDFNNTLDQMKNSSGSTEEAFNKVNNTTGEKFREALNKAKNAMISLGDSAAPMITAVANGVDKLATAFNGMDDGTKKIVLSLGAFVVGGTAVLKTVSTITGGISSLAKIGSGIGSVVSKLTGVGTAAVEAGEAVAGAGAAGAAAGGGSLLAALGTVAEVATGPVGLGLAAVTAAAVGVGTAMASDVVPKVDLFKGKISEATKQAVGDYMKMDDDVSNSLNNLKNNNDVISEDIKNNLTGKFDNMYTMVNNTVKQKNDEYINNLQDFFNRNVGMTGKEEEDILNSVKTSNDQKLQEMNSYKDQVNGILQAAADQHRSLTEQEQQQVSELQSKMRTDAVQNLSATEEESNIINARMKDYKTRLSAEEASQLLTQAINSKNNIVQQEQQKYDEAIRQATRLQEAGKINKEQYDSMVRSAEETRDKNVRAANDMVDGVKQKISVASPGVLGAIDGMTGGMKSKFQQFVDSASGAIGRFFSWIGNSAHTAYSQIDGVSQRAQSVTGGGGGRALMPTWNADGAIFTKPTLFANGVGVGDLYQGRGSNAEAVLPLNVLWQQLNNNFDKLQENLSNNIVVPIYMDSTIIAQHTFNKVSNNFAMSAARGR